MASKRTLQQRIETNTVPVTESGCLIWVGTIEKNGYCRVEVGGKRELAHRLSWLFHFGDIPDGQCVLHRCDIRCCVNPSHLFLGTKGQNNSDRKNKGRNANRKGSNNTRSKLTDEQVIAIRGSSLGSLALSRIYPVSARTIRKIRDGSRWGHVNG